MVLKVPTQLYERKGSKTISPLQVRWEGPAAVRKIVTARRKTREEEVCFCFFFHFIVHFKKKKKKKEEMSTNGLKVENKVEMQFCE